MRLSGGKSKGIDFEGIFVHPDKHGLYRCPYRCSDPRFPEKKWKTAKGFLQHMSKCPRCPSAMKRQEERQKAIKLRDEKILKNCKYKIGDEIFFVQEVIIKPTHKRCGTRLVRVRYEAKKKFRARSASITRISVSNGVLWLNGSVHQGEVLPSLAAAEALASKRQKAWNLHVKLSASLR